MYTSRNTIKQSEISIVPTKIKYAVTYSRDDSDVYEDPITKVTYAKFAQSDILVLIGANYPNDLIYYSGDIEIKNKGQLYKLVKHLYYENYITGSQLNSASYWDWNQQSTAYSSSAEYENRYISTTLMSDPQDVSVEVIYLTPKYCGEQVAKNTFCLQPDSGTSYKIIDDGNGNLIDIGAKILVQGKYPHVGNIIYSQGMIIITNSEYFGTFSQT